MESAQYRKKARNHLRQDLEDISRHSLANKLIPGEIFMTITYGFKVK